MPAVTHPTMILTKHISHVNLMTDTLIANVEIDDLRAVIRRTLASAPASTSTAFLDEARIRLRTHVQAHVHSDPTHPRCCHPSGVQTAQLFVNERDATGSTATPLLFQTLKKARTLFGAGLGIMSLQLLLEVVRAVDALLVGINLGESGSEMNGLAGNTSPSLKPTSGTCQLDTELEDIFAVIDGDLAQALQSVREEIGSGTLLSDPGSLSMKAARCIMEQFGDALTDVERRAVACGIDNPFERGAMAMADLKV